MDFVVLSEKVIKYAGEFFSFIFKHEECHDKNITFTLNMDIRVGCLGMYTWGVYREGDLGGSSWVGHLRGHFGRSLGWVT